MFLASRTTQTLCGIMVVKWEPFGDLLVQHFTRHTLSGLAYLHGNNIVHRGASLLVDEAGLVTLADFGIARHLTGPVTNLPMRINACWMAPELIKGSGQNDETTYPYAADVWSLGCTIIEMLTGMPPWSEYERVAAMFKILTSTPPIPETLSLGGKNFLKFCFQRNPEERPSAAMLLDHPFVTNATDVVSG